MQKQPLQRLSLAPLNHPSARPVLSPPSHPLTGPLGFVIITTSLALFRSAPQPLEGGWLKANCCLNFANKELGSKIIPWFSHSYATSEFPDEQHSSKLQILSLQLTTPSQSQLLFRTGKPPKGHWSPQWTGVREGGQARGWVKGFSGTQNYHISCFTAWCRGVTQPEATQEFSYCNPSLYRWDALRLQRGWQAR